MNAESAQRLGIAMETPVKDWKDRPLFVATIAAVGTLTVSITVFEKIVFPTQTAALQNEITSLRSRISALDEGTTGNQALKKKVEDLEKQLIDSKTKLAGFQTSNIFSLGNPYPIGLGQVKLGDRLDAISKTYAFTSIDRETEGYWSVNTQHASFYSVVYYFDAKATDKRVTRILFFFKNDEVPNLLHLKLVDALGQPSSNPRKDYFIWRIDTKLFVYKSAPFYYVVVPAEPIL